MRFVVFLLSSTFFSYQAYAMDKDQYPLSGRVTRTQPGGVNYEFEGTLDDIRSIEALLAQLPITSGPKPTLTVASIPDTTYDTYCHRKPYLNPAIMVNFTNDNGFYSPKTLCAPNLANEIRNCVKIFDYDNDLKVMFALYLYNQKINYREARTLIAEAIVSEDHQTELLGNEVPERQRQRLKYYFEKYMLDLPVDLQSFRTFCSKPIKDYMDLKKMPPAQRVEKNIKEHFLKDCKSIFTEFLEIENPIFLDAFFILIKRQQILYPWPNLMQDLSYYLYNELGKKCSPAIKLAYAQNFLVPQKKYKQAISVYQDILGTEEDSDPNNFFQTPDNYNSFAVCLLMNKEYESARRELRKAVVLMKTPIIEWNYACSELELGNYSDDVLTTLNNIKNLSKEEKKKYNINPSIVEKTCNQFLEEKDEAQRLLVNQEKALKKALERRKKEAIIAQLIKQEQRLREEAQVVQSVPVISSPKIVTTRTASPEALVNSYDDPNGLRATSEEKHQKPKIKEKKKTKGIADPTKSATPHADKALETVMKSFLYIEDLTENKNAWTTFYKLFWKYKPGIRSDGNVSITRIEIHALFKALHQKYDKKDGKGSHEKRTLNLQASGSVMGDQMVILPTHEATYLKPEYIKSLRTVFINAGVVPNDPDLIEGLKKDGF